MSMIHEAERELGGCIDATEEAFDKAIELSEGAAVRAFLIGRRAR